MDLSFKYNARHGWRFIKPFGVYICPACFKNWFMVPVIATSTSYWLGEYRIHTLAPSESVENRIFSYLELSDYLASVWYGLPNLAIFLSWDVGLDILQDLWRQLYEVLTTPSLSFYYFLITFPNKSSDGSLCNKGKCNLSIIFFACPFAEYDTCIIRWKNSKTMKYSLTNHLKP